MLSFIMFSEKLPTVLLGILVIIAAGFVLSIARVVIIPMVIAILFSFMLYPVVSGLEKFRVPRILAILFTIVILFGCVYVIIIILYSSINAFIHQYPWYIEQFKDIYRDFSFQMMQSFNIPSTDFFVDFEWGKVARNYLIALSNTLTKLIGYIFIVFIFLIFLFLEFPMFIVKLKRAFPERTSKKVIIIVAHITRQVGRYLTVKVIISSITGFLVWFILLIIGLDFPLVWGVLAFFLNFIPNIGSTLVVVFVSIQALVQFYPSAGMVILVASIMTVVQISLGNIIEPKLQGNKLNLSPVIILFSLVFWGWLWGITGALLSVPITVTIKIICQNIQFLKPVNIMMGTGYYRRKHRPVKRFWRKK